MRRLFIPVLLLPGCAALGVYVLTAAPSVTFIDSGELAAVVCLFGVAHPTGYPLFTLVGHLVTLLPFGPEPIVRLNLLAAFFCAAGVGALFPAFHLLLRRGGASGHDVDGGWSVASGAAAAGGALVFAFTRTTWSQALAVEVYSLHVLFLGLITLSLAHAFHADAGGEHTKRDRQWMLVGFLTGLSFTNHLTTVLLLPGLLLAFVMMYGIRRRIVQRIVPPVVAGAGGLSLYLLLPLNAARSPLFNWGNVTSPERFLWHITGKQYRVWIFESGAAAVRKLQTFAVALPEETGVVGLLVAVAGVLILWHHNRKLALLTLTFFLTCVLYAINYNIQDIEPYFLLAYLMIGFWASYGFRHGVVWALDRWGGGARILPGVPVGVALIVMLLNYDATDQRGNHLVEDYTMNMFSSLPMNSLVFSYQWDYWVSASYYYQYVLGHRPDVAVVDKELLRRSWYLTELERRLPWVMDRCRAEVEAFRREVGKFEKGLPYNPAVIQARFVGLIRSMIRKGGDRPVFVTAEIEQEFTEGYVRVPEGLAYRLRESREFFGTPDPVFRYRPFERQGKYESMIRGLYGGALAARASYHRAFGRGEVAERAMELAGRFGRGGGGVR
jgi:hypothetical protein